MISTNSRNKNSDGHAPAPPGLLWVKSMMRDNIVATVLAMIVLVPLMTGTALLNDAGKVATFEVLGSVLLLLAISRMRLEASGLRRALTSGPNAALAGLALLSLISCAFSPYKAFSWMETMRVGFGVLLYFVLVYHLRGKEQLQTLTDGLLLVTGVVSLLGFAQMGTDMLRVSSDSRMQGTFGSHELLGSFLMLMLPLALALGLTERGDAKRQLFAQVVALLAAGCLLMAKARFAWAGSAVSLLALSLLGLRYNVIARNAQPNTSHMLHQLQQRKHMVVGPLLILIGALALLTAQSQTGGGLQKWAATIPHTENFATRILQWRGTVRMIESKPVFGWGIGVYPVRQSEFTGMGDDATQVLAHGTSHSNIAHNFYLQTAAELGLVGLGLYLAVIAGFFVVGLRALATMTDGLRRTVLIGCLAAMAGQVLDAFGSPAYNFSAVSLFQSVLLGLGMFAAGVGGRGSSFTRGREEEARNTRFSTKAARRVQIALGAAAALAIMTQIVPTMKAAYAQTCQVSNNAFVVRGLQGQDTGTTITNGQVVRLAAYFNNTPANGTTFTISGNTNLVNVQTFGNMPRFFVTRNSTPGTGSVTITATYTDKTGQKYVNQFVINLR